MGNLKVKSKSNFWVNLKFYFSFRIDEGGCKYVPKIDPPYYK